jgi:predicted secreted protein
MKDGRINEPEDILKLRETFLGIKEMCANYSRKGALDAIGEINEASKRTKDILNQISEYVSYGDYEEAEKLVDTYLSELSQRDSPANIYLQNRAQLLEKGIPGLDIKRGLTRYGGDEEAYLRILRSYERSVRSILDFIEDVKEDAISEYKVRVHGIKGASYDIFAEGVGDRAKALEEAAKNNDFLFINTHNPAFFAKTRFFIDEIEAMISAIELKNVKPQKNKPDEELLTSLADACDIYSMKKAEAAMAEIEKYEYDEGNDLVGWLRQNLDVMNYKDITEKLRS